MFLIRGKKRSKVLSILIVFSILVSFLPVTVSFPTNVQAATTLKVYPAPSTGVPMNTTYTVQVQVPGGPWQSLDVYQTTINGYNSNKASFAYFDTDGPVNISVTYNSGTISSAVIRPAAQSITPAINGNTMTFSIPGPMNISVEVNGDHNNTLDLFANPVDPNPPSPTDPNVIYVGPGFYQQDFTVPSGKTLYIAGGAVIQGGITVNNATNAKVLGRGVVQFAPYRAIEVDHSNQITIDGIIVNDYGHGNNGGYAINIGNSTNVSVNNFKAYSFKRWTDGIDVFASSYVTINEYFARTGDDAIAIYGARNFGGNHYSGNTAHISVTNSFLQPDIAHPINIGTHGDPTKPGGGETIEDLNFSNITIWQKNASKYTSVTASDGLLVKKVRFTDITIEDENQGRFIEVLTFKNNGFGLAYGRGVNDVYVKNMSYTGSHSNTNNIYGKYVNQLTQNVTFENLKVNGNVVLDASAGNFAIGSYTKNINFIASGGTVPAPTAIPYTTPVDIARGKTATADSSQSGRPASSGNDGNTTTRWCANDGNTGHWWTVDLGSPMNITGGTQVMWEMSGVAYQYKIETSYDHVNWTLKVDKTGNTDTNQVQNDVFQGTARYVRITVTGLPSGAWASFYDFKVFGDPTNLAIGQPVTADSSQSGNPAFNGTDGNAATLWSANDGNPGHWVTVDLGYVKKITNGTQVAWAQSGAAYQYKIETSIDNTNWTLQVDKTGNTDTSQVQNDYFTGFARYVRITVTGLPSGAWASFYDFKVYGDPTNLALGKTATADSTQSGNPASNGNDGDTSTVWTAADPNGGHWWVVDLGSIVKITGGTQVKWPNGGVPYRYTISTSLDNTNWTVRLWKDNSNNTSQVQNDYFIGTTRYVKITVTGVPSGYSAGIADFKVFGTTGDNQTMAQLPFNQTSGTMAYDATGNGWNGTLMNGAGWAAGRNGSNAVSLNGTNQYVALPSGVVYGDNAITLTAWVNLNSVSNWARIFDFGSGTSSYMYLTPQNAANGKIRFAITTGGNTNEQFIDGTARLTTGVWHHVAVTLNGSTGTLYVNGQQVGSNTGMTINPSDLGVTAQNWIGRSQFSTDPYLNGRVGDFRIYNRALTASEVTQAMNDPYGFPIVKLPFDETSGTTANDATGNGWNGTLVNGASPAAGRNGSNAVSLDGTDQYVALPSGVVANNSDMTITAWVNLNSVSNWARIFDLGSGTSSYMYLTPQNAANGKIRFAITTGGNTNEQFIDGTAPLTTGVWHHVAVTLNGSTGTLYVNGQQVGSNSGMTIKPSDLGVTAQNWIGRSQFSTDPYLNGLVEEFSIYNRALTASDITQVMNGDTVLLGAHLPFDQSSGTTANDATGNGWDGTLANGASWTAGRNGGNAVSLNGTNQYVALPSGVVANNSDMTITAWVNLNSVSNWMRIFDFGSGTNTYMFLTPQNADNGNIRFLMKVNGFERIIDGTAPLPTGGWHHVAVTLNGLTGTLYVDGQQVGSNPTMFRPSDLGVTTQNWIGRSQFSADPYLNGLVEDFRIYNGALTASEVNEVMLSN